MTIPDSDQLILPKAFSFDPETTKYFVSHVEISTSARIGSIIDVGP